MWHNLNVELIMKDSEDAYINCVEKNRTDCENCKAYNSCQTIKNYAEGLEMIIKSHPVYRSYRSSDSYNKQMQDFYGISGRMDKAGFVMRSLCLANHSNCDTCVNRMECIRYDNLAVDILKELKKIKKT